MLQCADRPVVYAALMGIRNRLGVDMQGDFNFPLVHQDFFANEAPGTQEKSFTSSGSAQKLSFVFRVRMVPLRNNLQ